MFQGECSYLLSAPVCIALLIVCSYVPPLLGTVLQERHRDANAVIIHGIETIKSKRRAVKTLSLQTVPPEKGFYVNKNLYFV